MSKPIILRRSAGNNIEGKVTFNAEINTIPVTNSHDEIANGGTNTSDYPHVTDDSSRSTDISDDANSDDMSANSDPDEDSAHSISEDTENDFDDTVNAFIQRSVIASDFRLTEANRDNDCLHEDVIDGVVVDTENDLFVSDQITDIENLQCGNSDRNTYSRSKTILTKPTTYNTRRADHDALPVYRTANSRFSSQTTKRSSVSSPRRRVQTSVSSRSDRSSISSLICDQDLVSPRKRKRSEVGITTDEWHLNRYQTSIPIGWFKQLHKRECVKFVARYEGSSLCCCGKPVEEHMNSTALEEVYGDCELTGTSCIVSKTTDAIIKYKFENDPIESLFIRMDYKTNQEHLSFLLKQVLRMRDCKFFLHFLDFEEFKDKKKSNVDKEIQEKLETGLQTLAEKTNLAITSTGLHCGVSRHVHKALVKLCKDKTFHSKVFRLACPPWGLLPTIKRNRFVDKKMSSLKSFKSKPRADDDIVMGNLSAWFNHYLLFDEGIVYDTMSPDSSYHASVFRGRVSEALATKNEDAVNICVMINGGRKVLDHVICAMEKNIPVIIVKGTGGYADTLVKNYMRAETVAKKVMNKEGSFNYRSKLIPPKHLEDVDEEDEGSVMKILKNNQLLTVFDPWDNSRKLDMVIYQALLKSQKETQLHKLLSSSEGNHIGYGNQWMDFLIEAMLCDSPEVVDVVLKKDHSLEKHFTMHMVIRLYNRRRRLGGVLPLLEKANAKNVKHLGVKAKEFCPSDVRLVLKNLLHDCYPLTCKGVSCQCLLRKENADDVRTTDREMYRTCLPPVQEMFLWALLTNHQKLARVIWKHCKDQLASALVAEVLLYRMAQREHNTDREGKLRENAKEFGDLAVELLRTCYELDEKQTHILMRKQSAWWNNQSVMELAYNFHSRKFISQPASMSLLDRIWMGKITTTGSLLPLRIVLCIVPPLALLPIVKTDTEESKGFSLKEKSIRKRWPKLRSFYTAPVVKHIMHVISFVMFLVTFSYVLLVDLQPKFTVWQGVLCIWIASYFIEEIRQLVSIQATSVHDKCRLYWKEGWNQIDVISIALFVVGMALAVIPYDQVYHFRRVCLSIDFVFFCMRLLQAFSIGSEIGPMLTMILKMIRATVTFVIILFVFMISYAVASESILFPRSNPDPRMIYTVPRKAYWQIYGDFFLGEIEGTEIECTNNVQLYTNHTLPRCPSTLGQYLVPVLLAIYCIVTHVLMLNLLIAKFNDTYANVQGEAKTHWAWYRCLVFYEFAHRRCLPPPLNLFTCLWLLIQRVIYSYIYNFNRCCQCCPQRCRDWWTASFSTKQLPLVEQKVKAGHVRSSSIEVHWKCSDIDPNITRYRILCYAIEDSLQGLPDDRQPDLAVTVYSDPTTSGETCIVNNLASNTMYKLVLMYETKMGWKEYGEIEQKTIFKGIEESENHEAECVEQLDRLQTEDPIHNKLEAISLAMITMEEHFTKSINQVTGNINQLLQKEASVSETLAEIQREARDMDRIRDDVTSGCFGDLINSQSTTHREVIALSDAILSHQNTQALKHHDEIAEMRADMARIYDVQVSLMEIVKKAFPQKS